MDVIDQHECYDLTREGRLLIARLQTPHQVLSTSTCNGGLCNDIRYLVNHQSCEGKGHDARFALLKQLGETGYHHHVCAEHNWPPRPSRPDGHGRQCELRGLRRRNAR